MIERLRRPFGCNFLLDRAAIRLEKTVPFARIFSRSKATNYSVLVSQLAQAILDLFDETHGQRAQILEAGEFLLPPARTHC
jgi:hypothetical protein